MKFSSSPGRGKLLISPMQDFFQGSIPLAERGRGTERNHERVEEVSKVKLVRVLVTSSDKSHHLSTLHVFAVLLNHNLDSRTQKCY